MRFVIPAMTLGLFLVLPLAAGEDGLAGYWKLSIVERDPQAFWLVHLEKGKDGQLTATAEALRGAPSVKIENVKIGGDTLAMRIRATVLRQTGPQEFLFEYEGKLPKPGVKKILGSLTQGGSTTPAVMEATTAKSIFELDRDMLMRTPSDPRALTAVLDLLEYAKDKKIDAKEIETWVDISMKSADKFGPRLQVQHQLAMLRALQANEMYAAVALDAARKMGKQMAAMPFDSQLAFLQAIQGKKPLAEVAVETARRVGKQVDDKMPLDRQAEILTLSANALRLGGLPGDAATLEKKLDAVENQAYDAYAKTALNFKTAKFTGRKGKSDRAVLLELFTGAQCPPCVAADMAFDGLEKTYAPGEVVLLQYHVHIPGPDPMSSEGSVGRFEYYAKKFPAQVRGTPTSIFNGKVDASGGGFREDAPDKFAEFRDVVNKLLEVPAAAKVSASATRAGEKINIQAKVQNLEKPGGAMRLHIVLVEDWVRYKGRNGLQYHHRVVRALPDGADGVAVKKNDFEHQATVDVEALRVALNKHLDGDYDEGPRPMRLRHLSVVAFVQNRDSAEVLQAVNVAVKAQ